jgi:malonyl-CoA/methylmalonyl-CoA synthetase
MLKIFDSLKVNAQNTALLDNGIEYQYADIDCFSDKVCYYLRNDFLIGRGERVIILVKPGFHFVSTIYGIWKAGAVAVPIYTDSPENLIRYYINDLETNFVIYDKDLFDLSNDKFSDLGLRLVEIQNISQYQNENFIDISFCDDALIIYTSGTTGNPKGVVISHQNLESQIFSMQKSWEWSQNDMILNVLPLHHVHGLINALLCPLFCGANIVFLNKFNPEQVLKTLMDSDVNVFMAVPTIYSKLIASFENLTHQEQHHCTESLLRFRLMVSGSAALSSIVFEKWEKISGHKLLERYGMTEIGMALSNPLHGKRKIGYVGQEMPNVEVRLFDNDNNTIITIEDYPGEIQVKGPNIFKLYWNRKEESKNSFSSDGWFKTGDLGVVEKGYYKILGRISSDIIKSGGYKISAIEIEERIRKEPSIIDAAVVGLEDEEWGEIVAVCIITDNKSFDIELVKKNLREDLSSYKIPRRYLLLEDFPRNAMGKVLKKELKKYFITE